MRGPLFPGCGKRRADWTLSRVFFCTGIGLSLRICVNNTIQAFQTMTLTTRHTLLFLMAALPPDPVSPFCGDGRSRIHRRLGGEWTAGRTLMCRGEAAGCIKNKYIYNALYVISLKIERSVPTYPVGGVMQLVTAIRPVLQYLSSTALRPLAKDALGPCLIVYYLWLYRCRRLLLLSTTVNIRFLTY
jgi:hypothetical protein